MFSLKVTQMTLPLDPNRCRGLIELTSHASVKQQSPHPRVLNLLSEVWLDLINYLCVTRFAGQVLDALANSLQAIMQAILFASGGTQCRTQRRGQATSAKNKAGHFAAKFKEGGLAG